VHAGLRERDGDHVLGSRSSRVWGADQHATLHARLLRPVRYCYVGPLPDGGPVGPMTLSGRSAAIVASLGFVGGGLAGWVAGASWAFLSSRLRGGAKSRREARLAYLQARATNRGRPLRRRG